MCAHLFLSTCAKIRTRCRCPRTRSRPCTRALKWALGPYVGSQEFYPQSTSSHTNNSLLRSFCKNGVCWRSKVDERQLGYPECGQSTNIQMGGGGGGCGGRSSRPWDKGDARSQKNFFRPFAPQFGLKIRGAGPPGHSPRSATDFVTVPGHYSPGTKCEGTLIVYY